MPKAPTTHTITTTRAVSGDATSATTPPAASITAAANCIGPMARSASALVLVVSQLAVLLVVWLRESDQVPNPADTTAAHTHSTPAINMGSQYESVRGSAGRAPQEAVH